jgi:hypothetical protein
MGSVSAEFGGSLHRIEGMRFMQHGRGVQTVPSVPREKATQKQCPNPHERPGDAVKSYCRDDGEHQCAYEQPVRNHFRYARCLAHTNISDETRDHEDEKSAINSAVDQQYCSHDRASYCGG